jgi:hypothetical protein
MGIDIPAEMDMDGLCRNAPADRGLLCASVHSPPIMTPPSPSHISAWNSSAR